MSKSRVIAVDSLYKSGSGPVGPIRGICQRRFVLACGASVALAWFATAVYWSVGAVNDGFGIWQAAGYAIVVTTVSLVYIAIGAGFVFTLAILFWRAAQVWRRKNRVQVKAAKPVISDGWIDVGEL
jgi:hypothetical protein